MKTVKIKRAAKMLGMTKKELIALMVKYEFITKSKIPVDKTGLVAELRVQFEDYEVTELLLTTEGMLRMIEIVYKPLEGELYNEN